MHRWLAWNIFFRLQERAKHHPTFRILREMEAADRLDAAALARLQSERLRDLVEYAAAHVPYFATTLRAADVREAADLARLPLLTKSEVRAHRAELRSDAARDLTPFSTGGSTGEPLIFDLAKRRVAARVACRQRVGRWWGVSAGDPEIALWGAPIELTRQDRVRALRDRLLNTLLLSAFEMNDATIARYLDLIERRPPRQIFGYPTAIDLLCRHARKQGRNLRTLGVKVIFVTGEVLYPAQREFITETFNCPVANGYGGRDSGFIAHECPQGGMHVLSDAVVVEIVGPDGRLLPAGESGEIVVTDLYSHEAPFIRYATGDVGALSTRTCPCGRALPLIDHIEGRTNDCVVAPDGRVINSLALVYPLREVVGIEQFRIRQRRPDCFHVELVCGPGYKRAGEDAIRRGWSGLLRTHVDVTFEYLQAFAPEPAGKFRHVLSEVPAGQAARGCSTEMQTTR